MRNVLSKEQSESGWGKGLPPFIYNRMTEIGHRPTLRGLAMSTGINFVTLQRNLNGTYPMSFANAKKLAEFLEMSLDDIAKHIE